MDVFFVAFDPLLVNSFLFLDLEGLFVLEEAPLTQAESWLGVGIDDVVGSDSSRSDTVGTRCLSAALFREKHVAVM